MIPFFPCQPEEVIIFGLSLAWESCLPQLRSGRSLHVPWKRSGPNGAGPRGGARRTGGSKCWRVGKGSRGGDAPEKSHQPLALPLLPPNALLPRLLKLYSLDHTLKTSFTFTDRLVNDKWKEREQKERVCKNLCTER